MEYLKSQQGSRLKPSHDLRSRFGSLLLAGAVCLLGPPAVVQAEGELRSLKLGTLGLTRDFLQITSGSKHAGLRNLTQRIDCGLNQLGLSLDLVPGTLKRIERQIKGNDLDGYFFALRSAEREMFMKPLMPAFDSGIRLYWLRNGSRPKEASQLRVAKLKGAAYDLAKYNLEKQVVIQANDTQGLVGLLLRGRIDAVLGSDRGFGSILEDLGVDYESKLLDSMTFYLMISRDYLSAHPSFEAGFMGAMKACPKVVLGKDSG